MTDLFNALLVVLLLWCGLLNLAMAWTLARKPRVLGEDTEFNRWLVTLTWASTVVCAVLLVMAR